jgi:hypothetical protein
MLGLIDPDGDDSKAQAEDGVGRVLKWREVVFVVDRVMSKSKSL